MRPASTLIAVVLALTLTLTSCLQAHKEGSESKATATQKAKKDDKSKDDSKLKPFAKLIENHEKTPGLFTFYKDPESETVYLELAPDQFDTLFLCSIVRERGDGYKHDSAALVRNFPFEFRKIGTRVQMLHTNVYFRANEATPIQKAIERDLSDSLIASAKIECRPHPERESILVKAADFFIRDVSKIQKAIEGAKLDKVNSFFHQIKSYPANSEIQVQLQFNGAKKAMPTLPDVNFSHVYHYSLASIPESTFKPRLADPRIGHFVTQYQDYTSVRKEDPYVRNVKRWDIRKADPSLPLSPPEKQVVYWLENTIPEKYRDAVRRGALLWNLAFEKIGIKGAIAVKQMPDDAEWDAADARYNVIRWIVRPGVALGVGPSHAHPITGEIYSADVRITADWVRSVFRGYNREVAPSQPRGEALVGMGHNAHTCRYGHVSSQDAAFAWDVNALRHSGATDAIVPDEYINDFITDLVVHEVGHTLGLRHNFKGSSTVTLAQLDDPAFTKKNGTSTSVMDYLPANIAAPGAPQGAFFMTTIGAYDYWAIEYAYAETPESTSEADFLESIASRCAEPLLAYGTDQDASQSTGIDPSSYRHDLSSDPIVYRERRLLIAQEMWKNLELHAKTTESNDMLRRIFDRGLRQYTTAPPHVIRTIGGILHHRHQADDPGAKAPFIPVSAARQKTAMSYLEKNVFSINDNNFSPALLSRLAPPYFSTFDDDAYNRRIDYPFHEVISSMHKKSLDELFAPIRLERIRDVQLRLPANAEHFTLADLFDGTTKAVWRADGSATYKRPLQRLHTQKMIQLMLQPPEHTPSDARALARLTLAERQTALANDNPAGDRLAQAHNAEILALIKAALSADSALELE